MAETAQEIPTIGVAPPQSLEERLARAEIQAAQEEWISKYSFSPTGSAFVDWLRTPVAIAGTTTQAVQDHLVNMTNGFVSGSYQFNAGLWEKLHDVAALTYKGMKSIGLDVPWNVASPSEDDIFQMLSRDARARALYNDMNSDSDTVAFGVGKALGHAVPDVMLAAAFGKFSVARSAALIAKGVPAEVVMATSMFTYGTAMHGFAGGADFTAMSMLNSVLAPYSWYTRSTALATYMSGQTRVHGGSTQEQLEQGILGMLFGAIGHSYGVGEREAISLMKVQIGDWAARTRTPFGKEPVSSRELIDRILQDGDVYLRDHRPAVYDNIQLSDTGAFKLPNRPPRMQLVERLIADLGRDSDIARYYYGSRQEYAPGVDVSDTLLLKSLDVWLRKADRASEMVGDERLAVAQSLLNAVNEAQTSYLGQLTGNLKKAPSAKVLASKKPVYATGRYEKLPLGGERVRPEEQPTIDPQSGLSHIDTQGYITKRTPVDVLSPDKQSYTRTPSDRVTTEQQTVKLPNGETLFVDNPALVRQVSERFQQYYDNLSAMEKVKSFFGSQLPTTVEKIQRLFVDEQAPLITGLRRGGKSGEEAAQYVAGYRDSAKSVAFEVSDTASGILKLLHPDDYDMFNVAIGSIAKGEIAERRPNYKTGGFTSEGEFAAAKGAMDIVAQRERSGGWDGQRSTNFSAALQTYFNSVGKRTLTELFDAGMISAKSLENLEQLKYSPIVFTKELEKVIGADPDIPAPTGIAKSGVRALGEGGVESQMEDHFRLGMAHMRYMKQRIYKNRMLQSLGRYADTVDNKTVRRPELSESGKAIVPEGDGLVSYMVNGEVQHILMPDPLRRLLTVDPKAARDIPVVARILSGATLVHLGATQANWEFPIVAFTRDLSYLWLRDAATQGYSSVLPKAAGQMLYDVISNFKDVLFRGEASRNYIKYAGGYTLSEHLTNQAAPSFDYHTMFTPDASWMQRAGHNTLVALTALNERAEMAWRVGYQQRLIKGGMSPEAAARTANEAIAFSRGGTLGKQINTFIPYFNAGIQAFDGQIRSARMDPATYTERLTQLLAVPATLYMYNMMVNPEGFRDVSDGDKLRNLIVMLPPSYATVDTNGNVKHSFIKFRIENVAPVTIPMAAMYAGMNAVLYRRQPSQVLQEAMLASIPYSSFPLPPTLKAIIEYGGNFDLDRMDKIWHGESVPASQEYTPNTPQAYIRLAAGMNAIDPNVQVSPARLQAAARDLMPSNMITGALDFFMNEAPQPMRDDMRMQLFARLPFLRKVVGQTNKLSMELDELEAAVKNPQGIHKLNVTDPMDRLFRDITVGKIEPQQALQELTDMKRRSSYVPEGADLLQRATIVEGLNGYYEALQEWRALEKRDSSMREWMPPPVWFGKVRILEPQTRAEIFHERWLRLPSWQARSFEAIARKSGIMSGDKFMFYLHKLREDVPKDKDSEIMVKYPASR